MTSWEQLTDETGRPYYFNPVTNETSWTNPDEAATKTVQWKAYSTEDGKEYYYNETTGETTWDKPEELIQPESQSETAATTTSTTVEAIPEDEETPLETELHSKPLQEDKLIKPPQFDSKSDAEAAFTQLLRDNKVDSTWSFQSVMAKFIRDPTYWSIEDSLQRRRLYDEYLVSRLKEELSDKTAVVEKFEKNFTEVLVGYESKGLIKYNTRWSVIKNLLIQEDNPIFKHSVLSDLETSEIFTKFVGEIKKKRDDIIQAQRDQALSELEAYLTQINPAVVKDSKNWEDLYASLKEDSRFQANKHFNILTNVDILELYRTKIFPTLTKNLKTEVDKVKKVNHRSDRIARQNFKRFLGELKISANTEFKDIFVLIENEDSFIELCGRNGSSPLELFWDIVDEKYQLLKLKKEWIQDVMLELKKADNSANRFDKLLESTEKFIDVLSKSEDSRLKSMEIRLSAPDEEENEIEVLYGTIKKDYETQKEKNRLNLDRDIWREVVKFSEWVYNNRQDIVNIIETENEEEENSETKAEKSGVIDIIKTKEEVPRYTLANIDNLALVTEALQSIDHFKAIEDLVRKYLDDYPGDFASIVEHTSGEIAKELVAVYNSKAAKKRKRGPENDEYPDAKKTRPDSEPSKKVPAIAMNY